MTELTEDVNGINVGAADRGAPVVAATETIDMQGAPIARGSRTGGSTLFFCLPTAYLGRGVFVTAAARISSSKPPSSDASTINGGSSPPVDTQGGPAGVTFPRAFTQCEEVSEIGDNCS